MPYDWPIFNLADSFVVVGTVVLVIVLIFAREDPTPVAVATGTGAGEGHLKIFPERNASESDEIEITYPGNVDKDEALVEITVDEDAEKLIPLEDADKHHPEEIVGDLGSTARYNEDVENPDAKTATDSDDEKLHDLSRRPEQDK
ncbi:MAG: hypothetical protein NTY09_02730 [bacterium]|nr:hypothetical protein [bacterium]